MSAENSNGNYRESVIKPGDTFSKEAQMACITGYSNNIHKNLLQGVGNEITIDKNILKKGAKLSVSIDGEGTKGQIYEAMFDHAYNLYVSSMNIGDFDGFCVDLRERRLHDLIAMNTDDLLGGELCYNMTLYIHFEKLEGDKGVMLKNTFVQAMKNVSEREGISIVAGETAIMGNTPKERTLVNLIDGIKEKVTEDLDGRLEEFKFDLKDIFKGNPFKNFRKYISYKAVESYSKRAKKMIDCSINEIDYLKSRIMQGTYFSLVGTAQGIKSLQHEKLVPIQENQIIVMFEEKGLIKGPRANGISAVRNGMTELCGEHRPNLKFEEFIDRVNVIRENHGESLLEENSFSEGLYGKCRGKLMGEIATGKTTIYNQFIGNDLLGGIFDKPNVKISNMAHVTGNPLKKISKIVGGTTLNSNNLAIELDLKDVEIPPIMEILQLCGGIDDKESSQQWNMGVPYVITCPESELMKIEQISQKQGFTLRKIGKIIAKDIDSTQDIIVRNIGIERSTLSYNKESDETIPDELVTVCFKLGSDDDFLGRIGDVSISRINKILEDNKEYILNVECEVVETDEEMVGRTDYTVTLVDDENLGVRLSTGPSDHLNIVQIRKDEGLIERDVLVAKDYFRLYSEEKLYSISLYGNGDNQKMDDDLLMLGKHINKSLSERRRKGVLLSSELENGDDNLKLTLNTSKLNQIEYLKSEPNDTTLIGFNVVLEGEEEHGINDAEEGIEDKEILNSGNVRVRFISGLEDTESAYWMSGNISVNYLLKLMDENKDHILGYNAKYKGRIVDESVAENVDEYVISINFDTVESIGSESDGMLLEKVKITPKTN